MREHALDREVRFSRIGWTEDGRQTSGGGMCFASRARRVHHLEKMGISEGRRNRIWRAGPVDARLIVRTVQEQNRLESLTESISGFVLTQNSESQHNCDTISWVVTEWW
jgi:hypothetical protein